METQFTQLLLGHDLRKLKNINRVIDAVKDQQSFDELFGLVFHHERPLVMRAADAVEKISLNHPHYLEPHKTQLLAILKSADHKELKWHVAQLVSRLSLSEFEIEAVWKTLSYWVLNKNESKIVRVNALQGLFDLSRHNTSLGKDFLQIISTLEHEMIPSLQARIRKLKKLMD